MKYEKDHLTFECTGREIYVHRGIVGISHTLEPSQGLDGGLGQGEDLDWFRETYPDDENHKLFTVEERRELADYMISLWEEFAAKGRK